MNKFYLSLFLMSLSFFACSDRSVENEPKILRVEKESKRNVEKHAELIVEDLVTERNILKGNKVKNDVIANAMQGGVEPNVENISEAPEGSVESKFKEFIQALDGLNLQGPKARKTLERLWNELELQTENLNQIGSETILIELASEFKARDFETLLERTSQIVGLGEDFTFLFVKKYYLVSTLGNYQPKFLLTKLLDSTKVENLDAELTLLAFLAASDDIAGRSDMHLEDIEGIASSTNLLAKSVAEAVYQNYAPKGLNAESLSIEEYGERLDQAHSKFRKRHDFAELKSGNQ
ncbi:MAG: hypothetical protein L3J39_14930 [Verrucomicrobiales bacterium]|nr:hypothetical protein [Verrucomicrobiales bacterium]